jgi:putative membrane protein
MTAGVPTFADTSEAFMEFSVIALNVLYAVIGVVIMFVSYRVIDRLTPEVDFPAELQKGNVAVAIFIAAIFISIAMIIGKALG